jgi:hypothetical protein
MPYKFNPFTGKLDQVLNDTTDLTREPTGFTVPEDVIVTGDSTTRKVTLTGTVNGYYRGQQVTALTSGWVSDAHDNDTDKTYFLCYNGSAFEWKDASTLEEDFYDNLLIALAFYDSTNSVWVYAREPHGLMPWQDHREFHQVVGTYRRSGGALQDYVLNSTTVADRRPSVEATLLYDEDLPTTNPVLNTSSYTNFYLSGADADVNAVISQNDIVPLSGSRPYYNEFTGGAWQQTLIPNNWYMAIWVLCIPMASDTSSQELRYLWIQGQTAANDIETIQARTPQDISIGTLRALLPELVVTNKVIIQYTAGNWKIVQVDEITGTSSSQTTSPSGNYLTSVTSDLTLTGLGTPASPLGIDLTNPNTWTGLQTFTGDSNEALLAIRDYATDNNSIRTVSIFERTYSGGVGANGIGGKLLLRAENDAGTTHAAGDIRYYLSDVTDGSEEGVVGIGVSSSGTAPQDKLSISPTITDFHENAIDNVGDITHDDATASDWTLKNEDLDKDIIFNANCGGVDTEIMRINASTCRIGIGTATPSKLIHVYSETTANQIWERNGGSIMSLTSGLNFSFIGTQNTTELRLLYNDIPRMVFDGDNVYFGTNLTGGAGTASTRAGRRWWVDGANNVEYLGKGTKTDGLITTFNNEVQTTNATRTTLDSFTLEDENTYHIEGYITGVKSDGSDRASYHVAATVYRTGGGGATIQGSVTSIHSAESNASWNGTITVNGNDARLSVTGVAATTIEWSGHFIYFNNSN